MLALVVSCGSGTKRTDAGADAGPDTVRSDTGQPEAGSPGDAAAAQDAAATVGCRIEGDRKTTLVFVNRCAAALSYAGSDIAGGTLQPGELRCVDIGSDLEALNSKRYWGWIGADPGPERHTLAEFTFNTSFYDYDWYNISMVDAFNLPMAIVPVNRPSCQTLSCPAELLAGCPAAGQIRDASGHLVACYSPDRDDPNSPVAKYFESCDDAYAWSGDDAQGSDPSPMRACAGEDWDIVFCPGSAP